jgi:hypothetical protein
MQNFYNSTNGLYNILKKKGTYLIVTEYHTTVYIISWKGKENTQQGVASHRIAYNGNRSEENVKNEM